jgi:hypothetical protein
MPGSSASAGLDRHRSQSLMQDPELQDSIRFFESSF